MEVSPKVLIYSLSIVGIFQGYALPGETITSRVVN